ncbi:MAG: universal stress protein [Aggregatilineales bacterium]
MGYRKILVPLDGSKQAEGALKQVETMAAPKAHVHLIYVIGSEHAEEGAVDQQFSPMTDPLMTNLDFDAPESIEVCETYLKRAGETLTLDGYWVTVAVRKGPIADTIIAEAKNGNFDVIAIAGRGRTGAGGKTLGSVTMAVLEKAKCPVLVLPSAKPAATHIPHAESHKDSGVQAAHTS